MESKNRRLVMEQAFTLASGRKAVCRIYDDENIFMRAELAKQQKESAQGGGNRD